MGCWGSVTCWCHAFLELHNGSWTGLGSEFSTATSNLKAWTQLWALSPGSGEEGIVKGRNHVMAKLSPEAQARGPHTPNPIVAPLLIASDTSFPNGAVEVPGHQPGMKIVFTEFYLV